MVPLTFITFCGIVLACKVRRKVMYLANSEVPTNMFRLKHKIPDYTAAIQQKWLVTKTYESYYEWRDIPKVGSDAPDIEPYDENPNLCD